MDRRLAAILAADVVGYSALVGKREEATLRAFKGHMSALEPIIGLNGGRIVKTMGDGFLAEFPSIVDAVVTAETMQRQLTERNSARGDAPELVFRMGVHVGDIVADGADILGDGVNIAARLEGIAEPGGIVVSARVHEDVAGKVDLNFRDLGPQDLKNIARPVHAFAVDQAGSTAQPVAAPVRPDKPSVAVLAFDNLSSDPEQDYFADGITEDIITGLSRVPWIFVIARNSSFSYKGLSVDVRRVGSELGVRYVLEGSVRKSGQRLRVTGQLIDAETGTHIWADRYDGTLEDIFDLQDRITETVVGTIAPEIRQAEIEKSTGKRPENLDAYDFFLRGQAAINQLQIGDAEHYLAEAVRLDPSYSAAKAVRAWLRTLLWSKHFPPSDDHSSQSLAMAEDVVNDPNADVESLAYAGYALAFHGDDFERGYSLVERAITQAPNCFSAWGSSCLLNAFRGKSKIALEHAEAAFRLNPRDQFDSYRVQMGRAIACIELDDWPGVMEVVEATRPFQFAVGTLIRYEITALHMLGHPERAREVAAQFMALHPGFTMRFYQTVLSRMKSLGSGIYDKLLDPLKQAGIPE